MYHSSFKGNHYQAGFKFGSMLYANGINPMESIPISNERKEFAANCVPIYKKYYSEIVDEIKGMADGLKIPYMDIANFLFTMYAFVFENKCSCLAVSENGKVFFARNSDFIVSLEDQCDSVNYELDNVYSFIGNTTACIQMEDGINEYGLATALTFIYPIKIKPGFNAGILVRYILEKCKTTEEAISEIKKLPIGSAQTITLADKSGNIAVVECNCDKVVVLKPKQGENYIFTTNHFVSEEMQKYQYDGVDDVHSHERYDTFVNSLKDKKDFTIDYFKDLLSGKMGFMCQYDRKFGMDTVWSCIFDITNDLILIAEGNPSRKEYKIDTRLTVK